ncbi:MAG: glycosyltransferase [Myxococcota bacterium]
MDARRIAFIISPVVVRGGLWTHVRDLAGALVEQGHRVAVWGTGPGAWLDALRRRGVVVHSTKHLVASVDPIADARCVRELRRGLRAFGPHLVDVHGPKAGAVGRLAARGLGAAVVYTPHRWSFGDGTGRRGTMMRAAERKLAPLADRIISTCDAEHQLARTAGVGTIAQLSRVHAGVPDLPPELRATPAEAPARLVVASSLEEPKDPFTLLRALDVLRDRKWTLEWLGAGSLLAPARRLAASLRLDDRCEFVGSSDDVASRLAKASVLVMPTTGAALPLSVLEGMRAGLPVVASAVGGIGEAVDAHTGRVVSAADPMALSQALAELIDDPTLRGRLGAAGRRRYEESFTFARQLEGTLDVYRSLVPMPVRSAVPGQGMPSTRSVRARSLRADGRASAGDVSGVRFSRRPAAPKP